MMPIYADNKKPPPSQGITIAVVNGWPSLPDTAEVEYIRRFVHAAQRLGHTAYEVVTSDDINACQPDFVLTTHEFTPKLTSYFTVGAMWSPPKFYSDDQRRIKSILSYDGYLIGSSHVETFIDALEFSTGVSKPKSDFLFLPSSLGTDFEERSQSVDYELAYIGVHWDGQRHSGLLAELDTLGNINVYGPAASWLRYPRSYRGTVSFDGASVLGTLARHGIALCIHKEEHRKADTPSMRLFEAAAAGCLIIADEIPFARKMLGENAFYIDMHDAPTKSAEKITRIIKWANENKALAGAMAKKSHAILNEAFSLENQVQKCVEFAMTSKRNIELAQHIAIESFVRVGSNTSSFVTHPLVDIIVRSGGRHLSTLKRALRSVANQTHGEYRVLLVDYIGREDVCACAVSEGTSRLSITYIRCENTGMRSTALWAGLRLVTAPFFALLDDDDTLMPTHFAELFRTAKEDPSHALYYSGVIRVEEESFDYVNSVNFSGPLEVEVQERRELKFLDRFNLARLVKFDNYIQSNAWIARSECLDKRVLIDPQMVVVEDMYLYLMILKKGSFKLSPSPTAYWHWRSTSRENSMLGVDGATWARETINLRNRLDQDVLPNGWNYSDMCTILGLSPANQESTIPIRPRVVAPGKEVFLGREYLNGGRQQNVHVDQFTGVWTSATDASIQLKLYEVVGDLEIILHFSACFSGNLGDQHVAISINGQPFFNGIFSDWNPKIAVGTISHSPEVRSLFIRIYCSYTIVPQEMGISGDNRSLGVFLGSIRCESSSTYAKDPAVFLEP